MEASIQPDKTLRTPSWVLFEPRWLGSAASVLLPPKWISHWLSEASAVTVRSPEFFQKLVAMHAENPVRRATRLMVTQREIVKRLSEWNPEGAAAAVDHQEVGAMEGFFNYLFEGEMTYVEIVAFAGVIGRVAVSVASGWLVFVFMMKLSVCVAHCVTSSSVEYVAPLVFIKIIGINRNLINLRIELNGMRNLFQVQ